MSQHRGAGLLYCLRPGQGSLVAPAQPHGQRRWWDGILTTSWLHPSQWWPPAFACPGHPCLSQPAIRMVPSIPSAVQIDRQPHWDTLLLGMATPLFQS